MFHPDATLLTHAAVLAPLADALPQLQLADPALARLVRGAAADLARSLTAALLAHGRGQAARHRRRARAAAIALRAHLEVANQHRYHLTAYRQEAMRCLDRLVVLLDRPA